MPHLFAPSRPHTYSLGINAGILSVQTSHDFWERFNAWVYLIGGVMFTIGSAFFLPQLGAEEAVGCWIFVAASVMWLIVSIHDAMELGYFVNDRLHFPALDIDGAAAIIYISGSILYIMGSVFFLPNVAMFTPGAYCFIFGSILFVGGAIINGLQIFETKTKIDAQCMLLTAMFYVEGSVMFLVASIPYLFTFDDEADERKVDTFLGGIFIGGSLCFTVGGAINFHRMRMARKKHKADLLQESLLGMDDV